MSETADSQCRYAKNILTTATITSKGHGFNAKQANALDAELFDDEELAGVGNIPSAAADEITHGETKTFTVNAGNGAITEGDIILAYHGNKKAVLDSKALPKDAQEITFFVMQGRFRA